MHNTSSGTPITSVWEAIVWDAYYAWGGSAPSPGRSFAALRMTILALVVKLHHCARIQADALAMGAMMSFKFLMGIAEHLAKADKSAVGVINRPLRVHHTC